MIEIAILCFFAGAAFVLAIDLLLLTLPIAHRLDSIDKARSHWARTPHGAPSDADGAASRPGASDSPLNQENAHGHLR